MLIDGTALAGRPFDLELDLIASASRSNCPPLRAMRNLLCSERVKLAAPLLVRVASDSRGIR